MLIGDRLKALREQKKLSQGDIEKRTGQFEILELWAKDRVQQKRPETVAGDAVHAPKDCEGHTN